MEKERNQKSVPKAIKAEYTSGLLKVRFDNQVERYLKIKVASPAKISFNPLKNLPEPVTIDADGSIAFDENNHFTPQELWEKGQVSLNIRPYV
ncbi:hypothetical protein P7G51_07740 [Enterococcus asini]|uniref:hypothetical protein n=1 Tax=Enterococcus asini TaxID=57732 RepID=UPI002890A834|nr:hypothetical protein [Enterococcus asini]MDT2757269.1 hypothetical protein [Enterococcus asini]